MKLDTALKRDDQDEGSRTADLAIDRNLGSAAAATTESVSIQPTSSRRPAPAPHDDHAFDAIAVG